MEIFFLAGFVGGVIRGIVGIVKYTLSYKDVQMRWVYFGSVAFISGLIGATSAWVILELGLIFEGVRALSPAIALIAGYAGGDFLENIFKILIKRPILFK
jgi:hypothetical protein